MDDYDFLNIWISPKGKIFEVPFYGHNEFALNFLVEENLFTDFVARKLTSGTDYLENLLHWRRGYQWSSMSLPQFVFADKKNSSLKYNFSKLQIKAIIDLCLKNNIDIPERFKGD